MTDVVKLDLNYILACEDIGELVDISREGGAIAEAMWKSNKFRGTPKYYQAAKAMIWAEWRAGHRLRSYEGKDGPKLVHRGPDSRKDIIAEQRLANGTAYRWVTMSFAPRDDMEKYISRRESAGQPLKRADIIKIGKAHKPLEAPLVGDSYEIIHADLLEAGIGDESVDCIITDPPYPREFIGEYAKLSKFAERVLKPGGSCLAMAGQSYLPDVLSALSLHLTYHWTVSYLTPGGQAVQQWGRRVNTFWKPVLWFVKGDFEGEWIGDVVKSDVNDNDKRFHRWGQSESGTARLVEKFSRPNDLICDPFVGGGTTAVAALARGRRFVGIDKEREAVGETLARLAALQEDAAA
ncbi:MAG: DNA-methyltransferase [Geminicoccaceae bacterium]